VRISSAPIGQRERTKQRERKLSDTKGLLLRERGNRCEFCGRREVRIDSHHVTGRGSKTHDTWADHPALLVLLCRGYQGCCHGRVHVPGSEVELWALRTARGRLLALAEDISVPLATVDWLLEKRTGVIPS
jgi:hypothetical protein